MKKIKFSPLPSSQLNEFSLYMSKVYLNNIEIPLPISTIFTGHNYEGKYIKGYDINGSLIFNVPVPIEIEEVTINEPELNSNKLTLNWQL